MKNTIFLIIFGVFMQATEAQVAITTLPANSGINGHIEALNIDFTKVSINDIVNSDKYSKEEKIQIYHQYNRIQKAKLLAQKQELINLMQKAHQEHEITHQPIDEIEKDTIIQKKENFKKSAEAFKEQNRIFKRSLGLPVHHQIENKLNSAVSVNNNK